MKDWKRIQELEAEIARDEERYREIERLEQELMQNIPQGFKGVATEERYRDEKEGLDQAILENREALAAAMSQL